MGSKRKNWSSLQLSWHLWIKAVCRPLFGTYGWKAQELKQFAITGTCDFKQFASNCELKAFRKFSWLVGIEAVCRPLFVHLCVEAVCKFSWHLWFEAVWKFLALVHWSSLQANCGLKHFASFPGTCELKQFTGLCVALVNWKQFCKLLGTCELKHLAGFGLAFVIEEVWTLGTCELKPFAGITRAFEGGFEVSTQHMFCCLSFSVPSVSLRWLAHRCPHSTPFSHAWTLGVACRGIVAFGMVAFGNVCILACVHFGIKCILTLSAF